MTVEGFLRRWRFRILYQPPGRARSQLLDLTHTYTTDFRLVSAKKIASNSVNKPEAL